MNAVFAIIAQFNPDATLYQSPAGPMRQTRCETGGRGFGLTKFQCVGDTGGRPDLRTYRITKGTLYR